MEKIEEPYMMSEKTREFLRDERFSEDFRDNFSELVDIIMDVDLKQETRNYLYDIFIKCSKKMINKRI